MKVDSFGEPWGKPSLIPGLLAVGCVFVLTACALMTLAVLAGLPQ